MEINDLINLIVNNDFPVAVSTYLLIRLEKQIVSLSSSNTIISAKLVIALDIDSSDDSHKTA